MAERYWRLSIGVLILVLLSLEFDQLVIILIGWIYFEGISNCRLSKIISRIRYGTSYIQEMEKSVALVNSKRQINFEAERLLRISMATVLLVTSVIYPIWFCPWFVGLMLAGAGLTNICPMLTVYQWIGFKQLYH